MKSFLYLGGGVLVLSSFDGTSTPTPQENPTLLDLSSSAHFVLRSPASSPQSASWTGNITQSLLERQIQAHPRPARSEYQGLKPKSVA